MVTVYRHESKLQRWRALAVFEDGSECLVYLGRSSGQVRGGYAAAYADIFDGDERDQVRRVVLQLWEGAADEGRWVEQSALPVPCPAETARAR
ncbi:MAG TPA: hypothetical protein VG013_13385 [Gemmataceae bacterium]|jgi:hypothetical protein|nr:hypothetical protein [Gemmataceae bacterium]